MFRKTHQIIRLFGLVLVVLMLSVPVSAQQEGKQLVYLTSEGDVFRAMTPNTARIHVHGDFTLSTADFFRGTFRGVEEDIGDLAWKPSLGMTLELFKNWHVFREVNLTAGMETGFSDTDPFPRGQLNSPASWYLANPHVGVSTRLVGGLLGGLTYTYYSSPNDALETFDEVALSLKYAGTDMLGRLNLSGKMAFPVGGGTSDGVYLELGARPALQYMVQNNPITISFPLILGIGLDDYYGDENVETFFTAGVIGSVPLPVDRNQYGDWRLNAGIDFTFRDDALEELHPFDDGGSSVTRGLIGISFIY